MPVSTIDSTNKKSVLLSNRYRWIAVTLSVAFILSFNTYLAFRSVAEISEKQKSVINTGNNIVAIKNYHVAILSVESAQRGYILTDDEEYLKYYDSALRSLENQTTTIQSLSTEIPEQASRFAQLLHLVSLKVEEITHTVELAQDNKEQQAENIVNTDLGLDLYDQIYATIESIESKEFELQAQLYNTSLKAQEAARFQIVIFSLFSILLLFTIFFLLQLNSKREAKHLQTLEQHNAKLEDTVNKRTVELRVYAEELTRSNRELEDFAFIASHDLQEPLRKIQAFSNRLQATYKNNLDEKGKDYLQRMTNAASRMSNLIGDLLEFSRIKTRGKPFEKIDLNEVVSDVLEDLELLISENNAHINIDTLPKIEADPTQIAQLFLNLLSNALKFRDKDRSPEINVTYQIETLEDELSQTSSEWHVIHFIDNGIGFSQEYASKIFMPFQRLHSRDAYKGTGIGLAVCRRIVERHGGTMTAQSEIDKGTDFTILLPLKPVNTIGSVNPDSIGNDILETKSDH